MCLCFNLHTQRLVLLEMPPDLSSVEDSILDFNLFPKEIVVIQIVALVPNLDPGQSQSQGRPDQFEQTTLVSVHVFTTLKFSGSSFEDFITSWHSILKWSNGP